MRTGSRKPMGAKPCKATAEGVKPCRGRVTRTSSPSHSLAGNKTQACGSCSPHRAMSSENERRGCTEWAQAAKSERGALVEALVFEVLLEAVLVVHRGAGVALAVAAVHDVQLVASGVRREAAQVANVARNVMQAIVQAGLPHPVRHGGGGRQAGRRREAAGLPAGPEARRGGRRTGEGGGGVRGGVRGGASLGVARRARIFQVSCRQISATQRPDFSISSFSQ